MELKETLIQLNQQFSNKEDAIRAAGELLLADDAIKPEYVESMLEREQIVSTYMGNFVAIPHGTDDAKEAVKHTAISLVQVPHGVDFSTSEEENLALLVFGIAGVGDEHLDLLSKIAVICSDKENVVKLANAKSQSEITAIIKEAEV
ncbi:PTS sugar transporter subunit IIA [Aerococcus kribbianus]|uniref:Mannitol-specific phosphotransferase enzyme IIA component n=1 Tax=Aerococcus kribbianus TaxID=2999064 RepID=A0A9X3FN56_9LACT|nr:MULTISPECIES: PTS sugar transporter subunit IIA [unclassified Aerococcus]MCZ0717612.1 PTS sugar transporter subunit IIA [Aerococcus sp. YH-aer221]MCZ0725900.1 PTS sugar transporter subunit IIA [Aerococcus sp. YH-aer222]